MSASCAGFSPKERRSLVADAVRAGKFKLHEMGQAASPDRESVSTVPLAKLYRELRSVSVRAFLEGQPAAATEIADSFPRKPPAPRTKVRDSSPQKRSFRRDKRFK